MTAQRVIRRPRLIRLLTELDAPIVMVVAPAGYGKTTLARQWLDGQSGKAVWYTCDETSRDVAALAAGLARAAHLDDSDLQLVQARLRHASADVEADEIAELLADTLKLDDSESWLVIDDYHAVSGATPAERLFRVLCEAIASRVLICTRERPRWATARRLLYREIQEVTATALALTPDEAAEVLKTSHGDAKHVDELVAAAQGWPAAIAMAALSHGNSLPRDRLPEELHDFFAEELYAVIPPAIRRDLWLLSILPPSSSDLFAELLRSRADAVMREATRIGFVSFARTGYEMHPLLRKFLETKKHEFPGTDKGAAAVFDVLVSKRRWDDAFHIVEAEKLDHLLSRLLATAIDEMLTAGRVGSVERWLRVANAWRLDSPIMLLADAEVALRRSDYGRAEALALALAQADGIDESTRVRAWICAGRSAHFVDRYADALAFFSEADRVAKSDADRREALWGLFLTTHQIQPTATRAILAEYEQLSDGSPETVLRIFIARYQTAAALGGLERLIVEGGAAAAVAQRARDPYVKTSFYDSFGRVLILTGRYREAIPVINDELSEGRKHRLKFVFPSALCGKALIEMGLRRFSAAHAVCDEAAERARDIDDFHALYQCAVIRARAHLSEQRSSEAVHALRSTWDRRPGAGMWAEFLATRALALACDGQFDDANAELKRTHFANAVEARTTAAAAAAVVAIGRGREAAHAAAAFYDTVTETGVIDVFVTAYRAEPRLLDLLSASEPTRSALTATLERANDSHLAQSMGLSVPAPQVVNLTKRETEVLQLIREGKTNREIASALVISESTAKLHVRHILSKIGARSRTEAAIRASAMTDL